MACAPSPKTVANATTGFTGCPAESLAVFNYVKATRTWSASCGEKMYVCSDGRGDARCTQQQAETIDPELQVRAKSLLQLSLRQRQTFVDRDISKGDWPAFAMRVATIKALSDQQLADVDTELVWPKGTAALDKALRECFHDGVIIEVDDNGNLSRPVLAGATISGCEAPFLLREELAPLKLHPKAKFVLLAGVFDVKPIERPVIGGAAAPEGPSAKAQASVASPSPSPQAASPELDAAVRQWLDQQSANILACTGKDRSALLVNVDAAGKPEVSVRGLTAGSPEEGCVRSTLATPPALPQGPAQILHVVKAGQ